MGQPLRLMAVHAHPDDESSKGAAAMARYAADGAQVLVVTCTGGERGDVLNPSAPDLPDAIGTVRRAELATACQVLGVAQVSLGFVDSGLGTGPTAAGFAWRPLGELVPSLVGVVREFRPHVMLTYDRTGGYPHPDHVMCHRVSVAAFDVAADADSHPELGPAWQPQKLYYHIGMHPARLAALQAESHRRGEHNDAHLEQLLAHDPWPGLPVTTRIPCGDYFETADRALLAHESQIDPDGFWFTYSPELRRAVWPTEDFHLARAMVPVEPTETDLFAGCVTDDAMRVARKRVSHVG